MKKVFLQFGSGLGPMSRSLPIADALLQEGYEIKYFGFENARELMEQRGIFELNPSFNIKDIKKGPPNSNWYSAEQFWEMIGYGDFDWVEKKVEELIVSIKKFSPDIIISDLGILSCIAARVLNIPLVAVNQSCYHPERPFDRLRFWESKKSTGFDLTNRINKYLSKNQAKTLESFEEIFTGNLTIIPSFPEFDPISTSNKYNTHYVGPILFDPTDENHYKNISLFEDTSKPNIFCYTARFYDNVGESGIIIFKAMVHLIKELNANLVISTGSDSDKKIALDIMNEMNISGNQFKLTDYAPMGVAYGQSDLVIHHGGHGSCLGQFKYTTPSLIIPTHSEREYNARMLEKMGVSDFISRKDIDTNLILSKINNLLNSTDYCSRLKFWKEKIEEKNYKGPLDVINLIKNNLE